MSNDTSRQVKDIRRSISNQRGNWTMSGSQEGRNRGDAADNIGIAHDRSKRSKSLHQNFHQVRRNQSLDINTNSNISGMSKEQTKFNQSSDPNHLVSTTHISNHSKANNVFRTGGLWKNPYLAGGVATGGVLFQ